MTRKHYEALAACVRGREDNRRDVALAAIADVQRRLALECHLDNARFSYERFARRCEPEGD